MSDLDMDDLTYRAAERIFDQMLAISSERTPGREHWSTCLGLVCHVMQVRDALRPESLTAAQRDALTKVQPELDRLLSAVWHHGQWKLGELSAWQRVWMHLRQMHETLTREVDDATE